MSGSTLTIPAFAKINLSLRIIGKRPDGYHELETVLQTISLHDTITLTVTEIPEIVLSCDDRTLPTGVDNLVYRAAQALQDHLALKNRAAKDLADRLAPKKGARIRLVKQIPVQAGLGGGSADAAVTLLGLARVWKPKASAHELLEIARSLGADVPFFFFGGTALGNGIGDQLTPLDDVPDRFVLVLKPNANISTSAAYESLKAPSLTSVRAKTILSSSERAENFHSFDYQVLQNDFEPIVFGLEPEIKRAKRALLKAGAGAALLAGSGSAVFGIFESGKALERALQAIELEAGWRVFPCRTVGRNLSRSAMGVVGEFSAELVG